MTPIEVKMSLPSSTSDLREDVTATIETENSSKLYSIFPNNFNQETGEIKSLSFHKFGDKRGYRTEETGEGLFLGFREFGQENIYYPFIGIQRQDFKYIQQKNLEKSYKEYPSLGLVLGISDFQKEDGCFEATVSFDSIEGDLGFTVNLVDFSKVRGNGLSDYHRNRLLYKGGRSDLISSLGNTSEHKRHIDILESVWNVNIDGLDIFLSEDKCEEIIEKVGLITEIKPTLFAIEEGSVYIGV